MRKNIPFVILYLVTLAALIGFLVLSTNAFVTQTPEEIYENACAGMPIFVHFGQTAAWVTTIVCLIILWLVAIVYIVEGIILVVSWRKDNANT